MINKRGSMVHSADESADKNLTFGNYDFLIKCKLPTKKVLKIRKFGF